MIFKDMDIDTVENNGKLYIEINSDRGLYAEIVKEDVYRLAEYFNIKLINEDENVNDL